MRTPVRAGRHAEFYARVPGHVDLIEGRDRIEAAQQAADIRLRMCPCLRGSCVAVMCIKLEPLQPTEDGLLCLH